MRVDLESPIAPGSNFRFNIKWWHHLVDRKVFDSKAGYYNRGKTDLPL